MPTETDPIDAALTATTGRFFNGTDEELASMRGWPVGVELMGVTRTDTLHIRIASFDAEGDCWAFVSTHGRWSEHPSHQPLRYRSWEFWSCNQPAPTRSPSCACAVCVMIRAVLGEPS